MNPVVLGVPVFAHINHASQHILIAAATSSSAVETLLIPCQQVSEVDGLSPPAMNWSCPQPRFLLSSSISGEPGSVLWTHSRSVETFSDVSPCLNELCVLMERRKSEVLLKDGNSEVRIAVRMRSVGVSAETIFNLPTILSTVNPTSESDL